MDSDRNGMTDFPAINPFTTRHTRPGAIEYLFTAGQSADALVAQLGRQAWWGAILGPHGAGKSTLLHSLRGALRQAGRRPVLFALHQNERSLSVSRSEVAEWNGTTQVIVDGYEQLGWWGRWRLKSLCRRKGAGLLVTAHAPVGIAELYRVEPSLESTQRVVARLLEQVNRTSSAQGVAAEKTIQSAEPNPAGLDRVISADDVAAAFARQQGNVRETLFELHDLYRRRTAASA